MNLDSREEQIQKIDEQLVYTNNHYMILDKDNVDIEVMLKEIIANAGNIKYHEGTLKAYVNLAAHYIIREDEEEALAYMKKAKTLVDYRLVREKFYSEVAIIYIMYYSDLIGDIEKATQHYEDGLKYAQKANDMTNIAILKCNFSSLLIDNERFKDALGLLEETIEYASLHNELLLMYVYTNLASCYIGLEDSDSAYKYFMMAYERSLIKEDHVIINTCVRGLAKISLRKNDINEAIRIIRESIFTTDNGGRVLDNLGAVIELAEIYEELDLYQETYDELMKYIDVAENTRISQRYSFYSLLAIACHKLNKNDQAYEFEKKSHDIHIMLLESSGITKNNELVVDDYRQRINRLKVIAEIGKDIAQATNLDDVVDELFKRLKDIFNVDVIAIGDIEGRDLIYHHYSHRYRNDRLMKIPIEFKKNLASWVIEKDEELFSKDIEKDYMKYANELRYFIMDPKDETSTRSVMYKPIKDGNKVIGLFTIQSYKEDAFGDNEYEIFRIICSYLTIIVKHIRLINDTKKLESKD